MKTASYFAKERQPDDVTEHEMGHLPTLVRLSCARARGCSGIAKLCSWHFLARTGPGEGRGGRKKSGRHTVAERGRAHNVERVKGMRRRRLDGTLS